MSQTSSLHPTIKWAQRTDTILLTIELTDIRNEKYTLDEKVLKFSSDGGSEGKQYSVELELFGEVLPEESKQKKSGRGLYLVIKKKESGPYWPRLIAAKTKPLYIQTDFGRWKDEDESGSEPDEPASGGENNDLSKLMQQMGGMGGMGGMPGMGGMGGMPGMGGMGGLSGLGGMGGGPNLGNVDELESDSDSDDQDIPDLES